MPESIFSKSAADLRALSEARRWQPGERLDHRKLNEPVDAINKIIRGVAGARQKTFGGAPPAPGQAVAVVLLSLPDLTTGRMAVRRVQYATTPPTLGSPRYAWLGDEFDAFMAFGRRRNEYTLLVQGRETPTLNTIFLPATFEKPLWLVDARPIVEVEERVVKAGLVSPWDGFSGTMQIRRVRWSLTPPSFPLVGPPTPVQWQGVPFPALVDFGATPDDYTGLVHTNVDAPDSDQPLLIARRESVFWYLELPQSRRLTQFQVEENFGDYISAFQFLRGIRVGTLTFIAKEFLLRRTPFDGNTIDGVLYDYTNDRERTAVKMHLDETVKRERQVITPPYFPGRDIIYATESPTHGTGVVTQQIHGNVPAGTPVTWLAEVDGRKFAWDGKDNNP